MSNSTTCEENCPDDGTQSQWSYVLNKPIAIIVAVCYGIAFLLHFYYIFKKKSRYMIAFVVGLAMECAGFIFRFMGARQPNNSTWATLSIILVVIAPAVLAASMYMIYGRLVTLCELKKFSLVSPRIVTCSFVLFDVMSFILQIAGAVLFQNSFSFHVQHIGLAALKAGYAVQMGGLGLFLIQAFVARRRVKQAGIVDDRWTGCLRLLMIGASVIFFRSFYRVLEISVQTGHSNFPLMNHESLFYIFDPAFIVPMVFYYFVVHPSRYLNAEATSLERRQFQGSAATLRDNGEMMPKETV